MPKELRLKKILDYKDYCLYINEYLSEVSRLIDTKRFEKAMDTMLGVARPMINWGDKDRFLEALGELDGIDLSEEKEIWLEFYFIACQILPYYNPNIDLKQTREDLDFLEKKGLVYPLLFIEIKNRKGIFTRLYLKDIDSAIKTHRDALKLVILRVFVKSKTIAKRATRRLQPVR